MPTFLDESGDVGTGTGCAPFFRLCAAWFEGREEIDQYFHAIDALRSKLNVSKSYEFHFAKISHERRIAFFQTVSSLPFGFALCAIEKHVITRSELTKEWIRENAIEGLVEILEKVYLTAESRKPGDLSLNEPVRYDQCDDPRYEKLLKERFRALVSGRGSNKKLVGDVKPRKSKSDSCIQLADMICGAVGRHLEGDDTYFEFVKEKMIGVETRTKRKGGWPESQPPSQ